MEHFYRIDQLLKDSKLVSFARLKLKDSLAVLGPDGRRTPVSSNHSLTTLR